MNVRVDPGRAPASQVQIEALVAALLPFATKGLWEDNYPPTTEEWAESEASDSLLDMMIRPQWVRAARTALRDVGIHVEVA